MSSSLWLPPLIVLALGIVGGWWAVRRLRRGAPDPAPAARAGDLRLRVADLEARRDELYRRLRQADEEALSAAARADLERAAARTLRDLDRARETLGHEPASDSRKLETSSAQAATPSVRGVRPMVAGFMAGVAVSSLVGLLIYWAVRDATPQTMGSAAVGAPSPEAPHGDGDLPPAVAKQVAELRGALDRDPDNQDARKQLALTYLAAEQYVSAFQQAGEILRTAPDDPDALFVHGVVRVAMGQNDEGVALLDRVLSRFPDHVYALLYKGIALARMGSRQQALAVWRDGLARAGGSAPEIERLIASVEGLPEGTTPSGEAPAAAAPATAATATALVWEVPEGWVSQSPSSPMRRAQYLVPGPGGDAELVVFYFGPGQGGDAMANARRWAGQFKQPDGRDASQAMTTNTRTVGDIPVLLVEVGGTYTGGMSSGGSEAPGYRLLGAVAKGPDANWFFKLTGPQATIAAQRAGFDHLLGSLRPGTG